VRVSAERPLANVAEHLGERLLTSHPHAERQRVDEEADEPFGLAARAVGDRSSDHHRLLPAVPAHQDAERAKQRHELGGAVFSCDVPHATRHVGREVAQQRGAAESLHRRPRTIGGQIEDSRESLELLLPVGQLGVEDLASEPGALPRRIVGVLNREGAERRR